MGYPKLFFMMRVLAPEAVRIIKKLWIVFVEGSFGKGIDKNILDAYRFLCLNYQPGDEIYLFGFSRGAYTVRSLAGLMYNSGLLKRSNIRKITEAYKLYRDRLKKPNDPDIEDFRKLYSFNIEECHRVPITLLACWDTVGSLGIPDLIPFIPFDKKINKKYQFHDYKLSPIIQNALHAVAIDEQRRVMCPSLMEKSQRTKQQKLIQQWFPGDHGCVGGGSQEQSRLSDGALKWMADSIKEELKLGIEIDLKNIRTGVNPNPRANYGIKEDIIGKITKMLGKKVRDVSDNFDDLHESVKIRWILRKDYCPKNLKEKHGHLLDNLTFCDIATTGQLKVLRYCHHQDCPQEHARSHFFYVMVCSNGSLRVLFFM